MSRRGDSLYLKDIIEACDKIIKFADETDFNEFNKQDLHFDAIVRNFQVIGDATGKVSDEFINENPQIPWYKMKSMRNFLVHEYFNIDPKTIWKTIHENIRPLVPELKKLKA